tara:strand:- start:6256 stop:6792 length:537 start_codon:yes stop_codon:yes gene_type:complete
MSDPITISPQSNDFNAEANNLADGGSYLVETMLVRKEASSTGTPRLALKFRVALGSQSDVVIYEDIYLTDAHTKADGTQSQGGKWKLKQYCDAIGFDGDLFVDDPMKLMEAFVGKKCLADTKKDTWVDRDGKSRDRTRITKFYALDGSNDVVENTGATTTTGTNGAGAATSEGESIPF